MQKITPMALVIAGLTALMRAFALLVVLSFLGVRLRRFGLLSEKTFTLFAYAAGILSLLAFPIAAWLHLRALRR